MVRGLILLALSALLSFGAFNAVAPILSETFGELATGLLLLALGGCGVIAALSAPVARKA